MNTTSELLYSSHAAKLPVGWLLAACLAALSLNSAAFAASKPDDSCAPIVASPTGALFQAGDTVATASLRGQVLTPQRQPLEFANVLLLRASDSTVVNSALSDEKGLYRFAGLRPGKYRVQAKQLGYHDGHSAVVEVVAGAPGLRLVPFALAAAPQALAEVQVTGRRPPIERQIDRMVLHVDQLPAAAGGSAYDIVKGAPGVTVTATDAITMMGKNGVLVLIDDRPMRMSQDALLNMLRNMPAESIQSVEVITTPPAKYDAEGNAGIINIRTKQRQLPGWNTDLTLRGGQGEYTRYSGGAVANVKRKALEVNGSYFLGRTRAFEAITQYATQRDAAGQPQLGLRSVNRRVNTSRYHDAKGQVDLKTSPKSNIGLVVNLYALSNPATGIGSTQLLAGTQASDTAIQTLSNFATTSYNYSLDGYYTIRLDSAGRNVSLDANYTRYHIDQQQNFFNQEHSQGRNEPVGTATQFRSFLGGNTHIRSLKADVSLPWPNLKVETGAKYSKVEAFSDFLFQSERNMGWQSDALRTNQFEYFETTYAAYGSASKEWAKVSVQVGLRGEYTRTLGVSRTTQTSNQNNYFQLFPTGYFQFKPSADYQFNISYSRRISRPAYNSLNPFLSFQSQFFSNQGNPFLQPSFTDAVEWSNVFKGTLNVSPFFNYTSRFASEYPVQNPTTRETTYTFGNLGYAYNYGVTVVAPFSLGKCWKVDNNLTLYDQTFRSTFAAQPQQSRLFVYNASVTNSFVITPQLTAQLSGYYNSPTIQGFYRSASYYAVNVGATLKLLQDRAVASLSLADLFYTERGAADVRYTQQDFGFYRRNDTRLLRFSFTYKLGNAKLAAKGPRKGAAQEERNRAN